MSNIQQKGHKIKNIVKYWHIYTLRPQLLVR